MDCGIVPVHEKCRKMVVSGAPSGPCPLLPKAARISTDQSQKKRRKQYPSVRGNLSSCTKAAICNIHAPRLQFKPKLGHLWKKVDTRNKDGNRGHPCVNTHSSFILIFIKV